MLRRLQFVAGSDRDNGAADALLCMSRYSFATEIIVELGEHQREDNFDADTLIALNGGIVIANVEADHPTRVTVKEVSITSYGGCPAAGKF